MIKRRMETVEVTFHDAAGRRLATAEVGFSYIRQDICGIAVADFDGTITTARFGTCLRRLEELQVAKSERFGVSLRELLGDEREGMGQIYRSLKRPMPDVFWEQLRVAGKIIGRAKPKFSICPQSPCPAGHYLGEQTLLDDGSAHYCAQCMNVYPLNPA